MDRRKWRVRRAGGSWRPLLLLLLSSSWGWEWGDVMVVAMVMVIHLGRRVY
jgi:hypothetical protein